MKSEIGGVGLRVDREKAGPLGEERRGTLPQKAVAVVGDDDDVVRRNGLAEMPEHLVLQGSGPRRVVQEVHLEDADERGLPQVAALDDRGSAGTHEEVVTDIREVGSASVIECDEFPVEDAACRHLIEELDALGHVPAAPAPHP